MSTNKFSALKEALQTAQTVVSEIAARVPSRDSSTLVLCFSNAIESLTLANNVPSSESKLLLLGYALLRVCWAIVTLALSRDLAQIKVSGVLIESMLKGLKKAESSLKRADKFAKMSPDDDDPDKLLCIDGSIIATKKSFTYILNRSLKAELKAETLVEFSNVVILISSAITCLASKVALQYAWSDDYVCESDK